METVAENSMVCSSRWTFCVVRLVCMFAEVIYARKRKSGQNSGVPWSTLTSLGRGIWLFWLASGLICIQTFWIILVPRRKQNSHCDGILQRWRLRRLPATWVIQAMTTCSSTAVTQTYNPKSLRNILVFCSNEDTSWDYIALFLPTIKQRLTSAQRCKDFASRPKTSKYISPVTKFRFS